MGNGDPGPGAAPAVQSHQEHLMFPKHQEGKHPVPSDTSQAPARQRSRQSVIASMRALGSGVHSASPGPSSCPSNIQSKASGEIVGCDSSNHGNPARAKAGANPSEPGFTLQHPLKFVKDQRTLRHAANITLDDYSLSAARPQSCQNPHTIRISSSWSGAGGDRTSATVQSAFRLPGEMMELVRNWSARLRGSLFASSPEISLHTRCTLADISGRSRGSTAERLTTNIRHVLRDEILQTGGDDDDSTSHMYFAMTVMAWNCFAVFLDFCLLLQRVFTTGEWLCFDNPIKESTRPFVPGLNNVNYNLLCTMLALTSFSLVLRVFTIPGYMVIRIVVDCCHAACLIGGIGMLSIHIAVCKSAADSLGFKYDYQIVTRVHLILHVARVGFGVWSALTLRTHVIKLLRVAVSQNKRRFVDPVGGFDLDLAYVCDRVIAMAIPAVHRAPYRNDISEVARFFSQKHYGQFRVINLCEEFEENGNGNYAPSYFYGFIRKVPTRDHNACPLHQLVRFCCAASDYLDAHKDNVLAVHCRGGKGRTGMFVCALLLWTRTVPLATTAIEYFDQRRRDETKASLPMQTCTSPSQIRYVRYIQYMIQKGCQGYDVLQPPPITINNISITKLPEAGGYPWFLDIVIEEGGNVVYNLASASGLMEIKHEDEAVCIDTNGLVVSGDVAIRVYKFRTQMPVQEMRPILGVHASSCQYGLNKGAQICFIQCHTFFSQGESFFFADDVDKSISKDNFSTNFFIKVSSKSFERYVDEAKEKSANDLPSSPANTSPAHVLSWGQDNRGSKEGQTGNLSGNLNPESPRGPASGRIRFASFSGVMGRSFLRPKSGSSDFLENSCGIPRRESFSQFENAATGQSFFRAASASMRSALSSFKIRGSGTRRVLASMFGQVNGENPSERFLSSAAILRLSILEMCQDVKMFEPGELVFNESEAAAESSDRLYYIESGVCEFLWSQADPLTELGFTRTMCYLGSGDFYGVLQHLMGNSGAVRLSRVLVATTALKVRVLHLGERINKGSGPRLRFHGFPDELSAIAWEHIAQGQTYRADDLGKHLNMLIKQSNPLEKRTEATLLPVHYRETNAKLIEEMRTHLKLSPVDKLLYFCTAKVCAKYDSETQKRNMSTVCVLSSCLAFKVYRRQFGKIGGFTCNQIQWPHVTAVTQDQLKLNITFHLVQDSNAFEAPCNSSTTSAEGVDVTVRSGIAKSVNPVNRKTFSLNTSQNSIKALFSGSDQAHRFHKQIEIEIKCRSEEDASSLKSAMDKAILRTSYSRYRSNIKLYTEVSRNFMDSYSCFGYVRKSEVLMEEGSYSPPDDSQGESHSSFQDILSQTSVTHRYNPGDVILPRGFTHSNLYHVLSGSVIVKDVNEQPFKEILEDDIFGEEVFGCPSSDGSKYSYVAGTYTTCTILSRQRAQNWVEPLHKARLYRTLARYGCVRQIKRWDLGQHLSEQDDDEAREAGKDYDHSIHSYDASTNGTPAATPSRAASMQTLDSLADEYPHGSHVPTPRRALLQLQQCESISSRCTAQSPGFSNGTGELSFKFPSTAESTGPVNRLSSGVQSTRSLISQTIDESTRSMESATVSNAQAETQDIGDVRFPDQSPEGRSRSGVEPMMRLNASAMRDRTELSKVLSVPLGFKLTPPSEPAKAQHDPSNGGAASPVTGFAFARTDSTSATDDLDRTTRHFDSVQIAVQPAPSDASLPSESRTDGSTKMPVVTADVVAMGFGKTMSPNSTATVNGAETPIIPRPGGSC